MIAQIRQQVTNKQLNFLAAVTLVSFVTTSLFLLGNYYKNLFFPNTYINSINVSGLSLSKAIVLLESQKQELSPHQLVLSIDDISLASSSAELGYSTDFIKTAQSVFTQQHQESPIKVAVNSLLSYFQKNEYEALTKYDAKKLEEFLTMFNSNVEIIGANPSVELKVSNSANSIVVFPGKPGRELNKDQTATRIVELLQDEDHEITAQIASTSSVLTQEEIEKTVQRATKFVGKELDLIAEDKKFYLDDKNLVAFLNPIGDFHQDEILEFVLEWSQSIDRQPQNAIFDYDKESLIVNEFVPHKDGLKLDQDLSVNIIVAWLKDIEQENNLAKSSVVLPLERTSPEVLLSSTNDLGINERIGFGESYYAHSIPNRIHNVKITNEKVNWTIVAPGEEFSFNKTLGEVSSATGYRPAYIISGGKTVLGDGGGVCQVSSTTFRAVLDAGLDITKRLQHAYRVSYYELNSDPGFDATVYAGDIDFRFKNDTQNHIILVYNNYLEDLYMNVEIYGTYDGRTSEITDYKKWGEVGPLPTEYYPTNELPTGVKEQVDWAVGGVKTEFTHTVKDKDGKVIHSDKYYSNYRPWSAKYRVGI